MPAVLRLSWLLKMHMLRSRLRCRKKKYIYFFFPTPKSKTRTNDKTSLQAMECPICFEIFAVPVQLNCGHVFCWDCILKQENCALCRSTIRTRRKLHSSSCVLELLGSTELQVSCPHCPWTGCWADLETHKHIELSCSFCVRRGHPAKHDPRQCSSLVAARVDQCVDDRKLVKNLLHTDIDWEKALVWCSVPVLEIMSQYGFEYSHPHKLATALVRAFDRWISDCQMCPLNLCIPFDRSRLFCASLNQMYPIFFKKRLPYTSRRVEKWAIRIFAKHYLSKSALGECMTLLDLHHPPTWKKTLCAPYELAGYEFIHLSEEFRWLVLAYLDQDYVVEQLCCEICDRFSTCGYACCRQLHFMCPKCYIPNSKSCYECGWPMRAVQHHRVRLTDNNKQWLCFLKDWVDEVFAKRHIMYYGS